MGEKTIVVDPTIFARCGHPECLVSRAFLAAETEFVAEQEAATAALNAADLTQAAELYQEASKHREQEREIERYLPHLSEKVLGHGACEQCYLLTMLNSA
jgi:hypothetical protein